MRSACSKPRGNQPESPSSSAEPSGSTGRGCSQRQTRLLSQRGQTGGSGHRLSPRCPGVGDTMSPEAGTRDQLIPAGGVAPEGSQGVGKEGPGSARVWRGAEQDTQPCRRSSQASPRDGTARPCGSRGPGLGLGRRSPLRGPHPRTREPVSSHALPPGLTYTPWKGKANVVFSDYKSGAVPRVPREAGEASVRSAPGRSAQAPLTFTMDAGGRHVSQLARSDRGSTRSTAWQRGPVLIDAKLQQPRATEAKNQASNEAGVEDSSTDRGQLLGAPSCAVVSVPAAREGSGVKRLPERTLTDAGGGS